ncbi:MAG: sigma-70 family RNA polymerase sigma factor [Lachnospiraceae bacterium]|nr:sigma-70 family RNA polymerase sigma factor [Lachnospiraceae bacterium]
MQVDFTAENAKLCSDIQALEAEGKEHSEQDGELIRLNDHLIRKAANHYMHLYSATYEYEDAMQDGRLGVLRASKTYNKNDGTFATYSYFWINQMIMRGISYYSMPMRVTASSSTLFFNAKNRYPQLSEDSFKKAVMTDNAYTPCERNLIMNVCRARHAESLDRPISNGTEEPDTLFGDFIASDRESVEESALRSSLTEYMNKMFSEKLTERESWVLINRYGLNDHRELTLEECGKICPWGPVTRERIRQIEADAIRKIRRIANRYGLQDYAEG